MARNTFTIGGEKLSLSKEDVERKLKGVKPEPIQQVYVEVTGKEYQVEQACGFGHSFCGQASLLRMLCGYLVNWASSWARFEQGDATLMIYKKEGSRYYMAKFMWRGEVIRKSTRATDKKTARNVEARLRVELAKGNWNILEAKPLPTLRDFLQKEFLRWFRTRIARRNPETNLMFLSLGLSGSYA